jgi:hypothetical protein
MKAQLKGHLGDKLIYRRFAHCFSNIFFPHSSSAAQRHFPLFVQEGSAAGRIAVSVCMYATQKVWDARSGREVRTLSPRGGLHPHRFGGVNYFNG